MLNNFRIAISGKSGCGNTTVSRMVAERLGLKLINYTFRIMAEEKGMSFNELRAKAEESDAYDIELDRKQVELASDGACVLGSRLAIWLLKDADLKVYLTASPEVRAGRIAKREGGTTREKLLETADRDRKDSERYKRIHGIDNEDFSVADLVIDAGSNSAEEVVEIILEAVESLHK